MVCPIFAKIAMLNSRLYLVLIQIFEIILHFKLDFCLNLSFEFKLQNPVFLMAL